MVKRRIKKRYGKKKRSSYRKRRYRMRKLPEGYTRRVAVLPTVIGYDNTISATTAHF